MLACFLVYHEDLSPLLELIKKEVGGKRSKVCSLFFFTFNIFCLIALDVFIFAYAELVFKCGQNSTSYACRLEPFPHVHGRRWILPYYKLTPACGEALYKRTTRKPEVSQTV